MSIEVPPPEAIPVAAAPSPASSWISLALVVVSVSLATAGQFTLKAAMNDIGRIGTAQVRDASDTIVRAVKEPKLWLGLALFGFSAMFWLVVLSRVTLSLAYPFAGLAYVAIVLIDRFVFHVPVPALRWVGASIIAIGIALVGFSSRTVAAG